MLRFALSDNSKLADAKHLECAYLVGTDGVPLRAEIELTGGEIICRKRAGGPAGLCLLYDVNGFGKVLLDTTRLIARDRPYMLSVELLRGRLMRISQKREDWGLFDFVGVEPITCKIDEARELFISALQNADSPKAADLAEQGLHLALPAGEELSLFHADIFLSRRKAAGQFGRRTCGCVLNAQVASETYRRRLLEAFDFVTLPTVWRQIEPKEQELGFKEIDAWVDWAASHRMPVRGSPLVSFRESFLPDWLYIWEHDFETVRDLVYEHIRRVVGRYGSRFIGWDVISGIHAENSFNFGFEQLMELTRMAASTARQSTQRANLTIDLVAPWGEYYAQNQRTIPPMLYADMAVQSAVNFDTFGLQFYFGVPQAGMIVRDLFAISAMIDRFATMGKPVHITAVQVPSHHAADPTDAWGGMLDPRLGGLWHEAWSESLQADWLRAFYRIALSKPFVESVSWRDLADVPGHFLPYGGLLRGDLSPKPAYEALLEVRTELGVTRKR
jgi:hypothetical protein